MTEPPKHKKLLYSSLILNELLIDFATWIYA